MSRDFADYAPGILAQLEPPLPPLEPDEGKHVLDPWTDLPPAEATTVPGNEFPSRFSDESAAFSGTSGPGPEHERSLIEGAIAERGLDALAFYKSIRFRDRPPFTGQWGVFIFDFSIHFLADEIATAYPARWSKPERAKLAFDCLRDHEAFHFRVDVWSLGAEAISGKSHYETYLNRIYIAHAPDSMIVEESLANAFALSRATRAGYSRWLREFMRSQPGAYAEFDRPRQLMRALLAAQILHGRMALIPVLREPAWEQTAFIGAGRPSILGDEKCPTHLVPMLRPSQVIPSRLQLPLLKEVRDSFIPSYLSGVLVGRSDHDFVRIDNGEQIKLPNKHTADRLKPHEYKNILHKAGMRPVEFRQAREQTKIWRENCPRPEPIPPIG